MADNILEITQENAQVDQDSMEILIKKEPGSDKVSSAVAIDTDSPENMQIMIASSFAKIVHNLSKPQPDPYIFATKILIIMSKEVLNLM